MNHLQAAFKGKNSFWRYIVMTGAIVAAINTVGALPFLGAYFYKITTDPGAVLRLASNPKDLSLLGYSPNFTLFLMLFTFVAGWFAFFFLIKPLHGKSFRDVVNGGRPVRWRRLFISALVWVIISAAWLLMYRQFDPDNFRINNLSSSLIPLLVISVILVPFQASFEEIFFRGYLMQGLTAPASWRNGKRFSGLLSAASANALFPLVVTSLLFGLMHSWNPEIKEYGFFTMIPQYIMFGLVFGIATILDDGIEVAAGAHIANNTFLCIALTHKSSALQTDAIFEQLSIQPWFEFGTLVVLSAVYLLVMKYLLGWGSISALWKRVEVPAKGDQIA
jgi:membrane protease YdiL (CAAX protease family)